jgi:hypothetical protein
VILTLKNTKNISNPGVKLPFYAMTYYLYTIRISRTTKDSGTMLFKLNNYSLIRTQHRVRFLRTQKRALLRAPKRTVYTFWSELICCIAQGGETCTLTTVHCGRPTVQCSCVCVCVCVCALECKRAYKPGACDFSLASLSVSDPQAGSF